MIALYPLIIFLMSVRRDASGEPWMATANGMESITAIGGGGVGGRPDVDGGFRKMYGPKSTDSLTFSIARIMEPDVRKQPVPDYYHALQSAFKKYVPSFRSDQHRRCDGQPPSAHLMPVHKNRSMPYPVATAQVFHYRQQQHQQQPATETGSAPRSDALAHRRPIGLALPVPVAPPPPPSLPVLPSALPSPPPPPPLPAKSAALQPPPTTPSTPLKDPQSSAKTFTCNHCGKVFYAHYNLTRHMPVHTGARPFICKVGPADRCT